MQGCEKMAAPASDCHHDLYPVALWSSTKIIFNYAMNVPISRTSWSKSSQRTGGHYDERATEYESMRCRCQGCGTSFVFTAEAQQIAYEVTKKYVWWRPAYCDACATRLSDLQARNRSFQDQWNVARLELKDNQRFVSDWLTVLREMSALGKGNPSMETHLAKFLHS